MKGFRVRRLRPGARDGDAVEVLATDGFPLPHGFTGRFRAGGGRFGSRKTRRADLGALRRAAGAVRLLEARQVHGARIVAPDSGDPRRALPAADGLVATTPGVGVVIKTADCVPVLLADPRTGAVAGAHAGWRGTVAGVTAGAVRALARAAGSEPGLLAAVIGPAIGPCCYEVGPEVLAAFAQSGQDPDPLATPGPGGRPHLDLVRANRLQLARAGLRAENVLAANRCTRCDPGFHSYRRAGAPTGSNFAWVICR